MIHVTVYTTTTWGEEITSLRVRSLGNPALAESIATHTIVGAGIEEMTNDGVRMTSGGATVVRHALFLPASTTRHATCALLNSAGRKVMELRPGPNEVHHLPAGVYLLRTNGYNEAAVRKVIIE